ncbi:MAG: hypothetical protein Rubg2KO_15370 [Rubricoccaceae bacterium]
MPNARQPLPHEVQTRLNALRLEVPGEIVEDITASIRAHLIVPGGMVDRTDNLSNEAMRLRKLIDEDYHIDTVLSTADELAARLTRAEDAVYAAREALGSDDDSEEDLPEVTRDSVRALMDAALVSLGVRFYD